MIGMKVKALIPFAGIVTMGTGEVKQIPDDVARDLLSCGYVEAVEEEAGEDKKRGKTKK